MTRTNLIRIAGVAISVLALAITVSHDATQTAPVSAPVSPVSAPALNLSPRMYYTGDTCALRDMRTGTLYQVSCDLTPDTAPDGRLRQWQVKQP